MSEFVTSIALGSLYSLIAITLVFNYRIASFLNISVFAYIAIAPFIIASIAGSDPSVFLFFLSIVVAIFVVWIAGLLIDVVLISPLSRMQESVKVIVSISVFFILMTLKEIIWPEGKVLENPLGLNSFNIGSTRILFIDIVSIGFSVLLLLIVFLFLTRTIQGTKIRAFSLDAPTAKAYGISSLSVSIKSSLITACLATFAGVLLASPGSPRAGLDSVIFYTLIALAAVIVARHENLVVCLFAAYVIAIVQIWVSSNLEQLNSGLGSFLETIGIETSITLGPTFADRFIPFSICLIALVAIPNKWIKAERNG